MDTTAIAQLGQQLTDFLVKQFAPPPGMNTSLGFLGTGVAVDPNSFLSAGQFNPALINQWLDIVVDPLGEIDTTSNQMASMPWTATQLLDAIYTQAMSLAPSGSDAQLGFAKAKSLAMEAMGGATTVTTAPLDWYDPAHVPQWPNCSLTANSSSSSGNGQPPSAGQLWAWRKLDLAPVRAVFTNLQKAPTQTTGPNLSTIYSLQARRTALAAPMAVAAPAMAARMQTAAAPMKAVEVNTTSRLSIAQVPVSLISERPITPAQVLLLSQAVSSAANQATTSSVASSSLSLSLKYQVVSLSRAPWWSEFLLLLDNWYVPSCGRASMIGDSDAQKVFGVPIALILTSDVKIQSTWSSADRTAATNNTHLGPWALSSAQFTATANAGEAILAIPGIQAIACIYRQLPALPPNADPSLLAATGPASTSH